MKKIFIGLVLVALSSCVYLKGDYTLGRRNTFNDFFYTYNIRYYDVDEFASVSKETETVSDFKIGVVKHAIPGGMVVSSKILQKEVFSDEFVRPNMKGALVSYTVPVEFSDEKVYRAIGETKINDKVYRLLEPNRLGDVVLIDSRGDVYPRVGRIYNDRLALLETSFILEPDELKFENDMERRMGEEAVISGFEVRYKGVSNNRMVFDFISIKPEGGSSIEEHKTYTFPVSDKRISLDGITLEILQVNDTGIEYSILGV
ncbi:MAG: hypothetical protein NC218_12740 [Acetobacter sp.]|nr:hypothetical protein [Acetobacter sp.]